MSTKPLRKALLSRYRRLKIEDGTYFYTLALADRGIDLLCRVLINSAHCPLRSESDREGGLMSVTDRPIGA